MIMRINSDHFEMPVVSLLVYAKQCDINFEQFFCRNVEKTTVVRKISELAAAHECALYLRGAFSCANDRLRKNY